MAAALGAADIRPRYVYLQYVGEEELWHEHLAFEPVGLTGDDNLDCPIFTADGDMYIERCAAPPHHDVRWGDRNHLLPAGLGAARGEPVYRFARALAPGRIRALQQQALDMVTAERTARGLLADGSAAPAAAHLGALVGGPPPVVPAGAPPALAGAEAFFVVIGTNLHQKGEEIAFGPGAVWLGGFALIPVADGEVFASRCLRRDADVHISNLLGPLVPVPIEEDLEDVRTLPVRFEKTGERYRLFDESVALMTEEPFDADEWPLEGPRSAYWWLKSTRRLGMTPLARHQKWVHESGVTATDRSIHEHELLSQVIEAAATVDQLNVSSLVSFESLIRRLQFIEEAHAISPTAPSYEAAEHWMGSNRRKGGILINPALMKHVAEKVKDETSVAKERRKAKEERRLAPAHKKKGGGKGGSGAGAADEG
jgi:hypothetical protein